MKRYLVLYGIGGIFDDYQEVAGRSAADALARHFSSDIALYRRSSIERGDVQFILREFVERGEHRFWAGPHIGVRRMQPKIIRETAA